jgi:hypothetical protein
MLNEGLKRAQNLMRGNTGILRTLGTADCRKVVNLFEGG